MHLTRKTSIFVACAAMVVFAVPAFAQAPAIDYVGYSWETGGFPPSVAGDELVCLGVTSNLDPIFGVDLGVDELTFHLYGLISTGEVPLGGGMVMVTYTGGMMDVWRDGAQNADWGLNPPNPTAPASFVDGTLFFRGAFNDFTVFMLGDGSGSFEGTLNGLGGEVLGDLCTDCAYTWGGTYTQLSAQVPDGYDMQMDGELLIEGSVAEDVQTWSGVKALFR